MHFLKKRETRLKINQLKIKVNEWKYFVMVKLWNVKYFQNEQQILISSLMSTYVKKNINLIFFILYIKTIICYQDF